MHLMYTLDENGNRVYTLKCVPTRHVYVHPRSWIQTEIDGQG